MQQHTRGMLKFQTHDHTCRRLDPCQTLANFEARLTGSANRETDGPDGSNYEDALTSL